MTRKHKLGLEAPNPADPEDLFEGFRVWGLSLGAQGFKR